MPTVVGDGQAPPAFSTNRPQLTSSVYHSNFQFYCTFRHSAHDTDLQIWFFINCTLLWASPLIPIHSCKIEIWWYLHTTIVWTCMEKKRIWTRCTVDWNFCVLIYCVKVFHDHENFLTVLNRFYIPRLSNLEQDYTRQQNVEYEPNSLLCLWLQCSCCWTTACEKNAV